MTDVDLQPDADAQPSTPLAEQLRVPQFGILHLLLWTVAAALLLKYLLVLQKLEERFRPPLSFMDQATRSLNAIIVASTLLGSGVLLLTRCPAKFKRLQPGHWLVLILTLNSILSMVEWVLYRFLESFGIQSMSTYLFSAAVIGIVLTVVSGLAIVLLRDANRWKTLIGAFALGRAAIGVVCVLCLVVPMDPYLFSSGLNWITLSSTAWSAAILAMLLAVLVLDLPRRASRDWLHWLGVGVLGLLSAMALASRILERFFVNT
jgi:hypothetical protein